MKVAHGWRPGAISKHLLRKLNKAKRIKSSVVLSKPSKKPKRCIEDKPTLIISKRSGDYRIEMQVTPSSVGYQDQCTPLVYKIAKADNEDRIRKLERKKRRLIRKAVGDVWSDSCHPEICEKTCLKAYKQAIALLPLDPNNPGCICDIEDNMERSCSSDEDIISDCSSMDMDWEIRYSLPYHS